MSDKNSKKPFTVVLISCGVCLLTMIGVVIFWSYSPTPTTPPTIPTSRQYSWERIDDGRGRAIERMIDKETGVVLYVTNGGGFTSQKLEDDK